MKTSKKAILPILAALIASLCASCMESGSANARESGNPSQIQSRGHTMGGSNGVR